MDVLLFNMHKFNVDLNKISKVVFFHMNIEITQEASGF